MGNLKESLGTEYIQQMCVGAIFEVDGTAVHMLRGVQEDSYATKALDLTAEHPRWKSTRLPFDKLTSLASFSYPKLGYRMMESPDQGPIVVSLTNRRSAYRGLRLEQLMVEYMPVYLTLVPQFYEAWHTVGSEVKIKTIFRPSFWSFAEGIKQLMTGDALAFAVSEDIAVSMAHDMDRNKLANIYFKDKIVGSVSTDGTIALANKILQRDTLRRKFEK